MNELFRSELHRYRLWTAALAVVHLAVLGFFTRIVDPLQQPLLVYQLAGGIYALCGLLLGLHQFVTHRRSSAWLFLLHRPLPPRRIAFALVGSAAVSLTIALVVPLALIVGGQAIWSARVVDLRHGLLPIATLLVSLSAYLAGAYSALSTSRLAILVVAAPAFVLTGAATGPAAIAAQAVVVAALLALVASAFKPDLTTPPLRFGVQLAHAVPLAVGVNFLFVAVGGLAFQLGWILLGSHPLNSTPPRGGFVEAVRAEGRDLLDAGLAAAAEGGSSGAENAEIAFEREQVRISDVWTTGPELPRLATRHELTNFAPAEIDDERRNLRITFSHDDLRFHRVALADGSAAGSLGLGPEPGEPFPGVPIVDGSGVALFAGAVHRYDVESGHWRRWLRMPEGESVAAPPESAGEAIALVTDRSLLIYEPRTAAEGAELLPRLRIAIPAPIGELARIDFVERLDGLLVSFLVGSGTVDAPGAAWQQIERVDGDGARRVIVRRDLRADFPTFVRYRREWVSPLFARVEERLRHLFASSHPLTARAPVELPVAVMALALLLHVAAAAAAFALLRRGDLSSAMRWSWVVAGALGGPPAALALWLLRPERFAAVAVSRERAIAPGLAAGLPSAN